jgi:hypothetical protein
MGKGLYELVQENNFILQDVNRLHTELKQGNQLQAGYGALMVEYKAALERLESVKERIREIYKKRLQG